MVTLESRRGWLPRLAGTGCQSTAGTLVWVTRGGSGVTVVVILLLLVVVAAAVVVMLAMGVVVRRAVARDI